MPSRALAAQRADEVSRAPFGRLSSPVLVGRERELSLLLEAAEQAPAFVVVEGEPGIGKTRLVDELLARLELRRRHRYLGRCQQLGEPFPLGPLVEALREASFAAAALGPVTGALRPLLPEFAARLPAPLEPLGDARAERHRLFRAVRELLGALGPAILVLEDLHWADDATVELLRFLAPQPPPELTLVCTYRREDLPTDSPLPGLPGRVPREAHGLTLELEALDQDGVRELVATILEADDVSDEFAAHLRDDSGGLPFAVEEILRLLRERHDVVRRRGVWLRTELEEIRLPLALRDAVLERVGRLSAPAQRLVQAAAVLATASDEDVLLDTAGLTETGAGYALDEALSSAVLTELGEGRYGFRHVLARQAVLDALAPSVRRRLHRRAAAALETLTPTPHSRLAHHYQEAGKTDEWIRHAEAAADRAESLEDDATAYRFLKDAVVVPGLPAATKARLAAKLAAHARQCLAHDEAIDILRQVLGDRVLPLDVRGELRVWLARLLTSAGRHSEAASEATRAVEELSRRPELAASAMLCVTVPWEEPPGLDERLDWLDRAVQTAARSSDRAVKIAVAGRRAGFLLLVGDPRGARAVEEIPEPGSAPAELGRAAHTYNNLADSLLHQGYVERAGTLLRASTSFLERSGNTQDYAQRITALQLRWLAGEWSGLEERASSYIRDWEDHPRLRADPEVVLALLLLARGQVQASGRRLAALAADFAGESAVLGWLSAGLARIRLAEGRSDSAFEETCRVFEIIDTKGVWAWATDAAPVAVEALLAAGRTTEAAELVDRFARGLEGRDAPAASAALVVCRALVDEAAEERERAARRFLAAERAWRALPRPYEAARAREAAGRCLLSQRAERGARLLGEAMDAFHVLGATWDAARARRALREHGVTPPHRGGRRSYRDELSPREAEVAALASEGLSNREIALTLFLSQKTVEGHLRSSMRKLGVASRTELATQLRDAAAGLRLTT
jgi:DNA-binding CsgD family transcriptional regulator/tetratricopeptide (TPR) repeat protein